jgi:hypothetical protein
MKEFETSVIEGTKSYFEKNNFPVETVSLNDEVIPYYVLPPHLEPALPDFSVRITSTNLETGEVTGIFGVSESVPPELRPHWAKHEMIEFLQIGIDFKGRCSEAECAVLEEIPEEIRLDYIARRVVFFNNLTEYFKNDIDEERGNYTPDDLREAQACLIMLKSLL